MNDMKMIAVVVNKMPLSCKSCIFCKNASRNLPPNQSLTGTAFFCKLTGKGLWREEFSHRPAGCPLILEGATFVDWIMECERLENHNN
jgi:hypothetical protein